jgi:PelA/Pel-15E family pectate lyase
VSHALVLRSAAIVTALGVAAGAVCGAQTNPMDSIRTLASYRPAFDTVTLLAPDRIARLEPDHRTEWDAYLARSDARYAADTAAMHAELRVSGMTAMVRAPYAHAFAVDDSMTDAWFRTPAARRIADIIVSFQAPNGGWSKHVDLTQHARRPGESYFAESADWEWISTVDNDQTTSQIDFLARENAVHRDPRYEQSIRRGIDFLLAMQYPNGCFPQIYPLEGNYHDAATFNDNAMVNALVVLRGVGAGKYAEATPSQRPRAAAAVDRGVDCLLAAQGSVNGTLTAWGQQHDPLTLAPTSARSYELTSVASLESAAIVDFLMALPSPSARTVRAVYAAADWLAGAGLSGLTYQNYQLTHAPAAAPLWGRLYELGTSRVIMANRDGVKRYDWNELTDRRAGYQWYTTAPAATLARFARWSRAHPRPFADR